MPGNITSANATILLTIPLLFPIPQQLQRFSADDVFSTTPIKSSENVMGVDGHLSGGFIFVPIEWAISLMPDSESCIVFDNWWAAQQVALNLFRADAVIALPAIGRKWTLTNGILGDFPPMPDAGKTLKARKFGITWEKMSPAPI